MARPSKSANITNKKLANSVKKTRLEVENTLKGNSNKILPPVYLNQHQVEIFNYIVAELLNSKLLGNLDIYILAQCSISIDRVQTIETMINNDIELLCSTTFMASKDKYTKDLFRCCNELSLSPQARAKFGNINGEAEKQKADPLLKLLSGGKGG